jgi:hypothetical protein
MLEAGTMTRAGVIGLLVCVSACGPIGRSGRRAAVVVDELREAGFRAVVADTPEKRARLESIPARQFRFARQDGKPIYVYPDPAGCGCAYVGNEAAYQRLQDIHDARALTDSEKAQRKADASAGAIEAMNAGLPADQAERIYDAGTEW